MANVSQREHKASINCVLLKLKEIRTDIKTLDTRLDEKNKLCLFLMKRALRRLLFLNFV